MLVTAIESQSRMGMLGEKGEWLVCLRREQYRWRRQSDEFVVGVMGDCWKQM